MIIRFGCANYKSIFTYQQLLLTASKLKDSQSETIDCKALPEQLLPSVALYGANGSGKTNMIEALRFLVKFILDSFKNDTTGISRPAFKLVSDAHQNASEFDVDFIFGDQHYHYGFKINDDEILEEWLYAFAYEQRKARTVLFHRNKQEANEYKFSPSLKGENKVIAKLTRANSLFLSSAAQNNHDLLGNIYDYFKTQFSFRFETETNPDLIARHLKRFGNIQQVDNFLNHADLGIESMELQTKLREDDDQDYKMIIALTDIFNVNAKQSIDAEDFKEHHSVKLYHKDQNGNLISFGLEEESLGTRVMIGLLMRVFNLLKKGGVFIVDELESSMHPLLSIQLIRLFNQEKTNPKFAQLIFTTHDTNLLASNVFRRDQIWFSEKTQSGETMISPLSDYNLRKTDNIRNGYLEGRFGAIPFLGDLENLLPLD